MPPATSVDRSGWSNGARPRPSSSSRSRGPLLPRRSGGIRAINELDLDRFRPFAEEELGRAGDERAPGGGPWAAEAGADAGMIVVRDGAWCTTSSIPAWKPKVCVRAASPRAKTTSCAAHRASVERVGRCVHGLARRVPRRRRVHSRSGRGRWSKIRFSSCTGAKATARPRSRTRWCRWARAPKRRCSIASARLRPITSSTRSPNCCSKTTRTSGISPCKSTARVPGISDSSGPSSDATHRCARAPSRSAATTPGCAARPASTGKAARATSSPCTSATAPKCSTSAHFRITTRPRTRSDLLFKGAVEDTASLGVLRARALCGNPRRRPTCSKPTATSCSVKVRPRSRFRTSRSRPTTSSVRTLSTVGPIDDDQRYYLESRGIAPEEAERLIVLGFFDDVFHRLPVGALTRGLRASVVEKLEHRRGRHG